LATCAQFRRKFAYTVIDSPPIGTVADFDLIQAGCDASILVVRPDRTDRQACFRAIETMPKGKCLGIVVNVVPKWLFGKNYYGDQYSYYYDAR
jgi:Mrp family chromosome partitioning ATPase